MDVAIIRAGRWGLSRPLFVNGGWTTYAMEQRLAPIVENYFPPRGAGGVPLVSAVLVRLRGSVTAPQDGNTVLFPRDLVDLADVTLGELTAAQRNAIRNVLTEWLTGYTFRDFDGSERVVPAFADRVAGYTAQTTLKEVARDIFRHMAHSVSRPKAGVVETHNTEYLDDFSTDPAPRYTAIGSSQTPPYVWDSVNQEMDIDNLHPGGTRACMAYTANDVGSMSQEAQVTCNGGAGAAGDAGVGVRCHGTNADWYMLSHYPDSDELILRRVVGDGGTVLATVALNVVESSGGIATVRAAAEGAVGENVVLSGWDLEHGTTKPSDPGWIGVDGSPDLTYTDTSVDRLDDADDIYCGPAVHGAGLDYDTRHCFFKQRAISDRAGGTTFNQSIDGTLTSAGAMVREVRKGLAGSIASAGAVAKETRKTMGGTVTSAGVVGTVKTRLQAVGDAALTMAGGVVREVRKVVAGSIASAGVVAKETRKTMGGTVTSAGTVGTIKTRLQAVGDATLTTAGAMVREVRKGLAGSIASAGVLTKTTPKDVGGTLTTAGTIETIRTRLQAVGDAVLTMAGVVVRETRKGVGGVLGMSGTAGKLFQVAIGGTLGPVGSVVGSLVGAVLVATNVAAARVRAFVAACIARVFVVPARMEGVMEWTAEIEKQSGEEIPYAVDYTDRLPPGKTVSSAAIEAAVYPNGTDAAGTVLSGVATVTTTRITQLIVGGVNGTDYRITFKANLSGGGVLEDDVLVKVRDL